MNFKELENKLGIQIKNPEILEMAFIHRSFLNETNLKLRSNERIEFLGDSILSFLVSKFLYHTFPDQPEGELTSLRSSIVKTATLAEIARELSLGDMLKLSKGENESMGRSNPSLLADTFEALLGAVYLDQGLPQVEKIIHKYLLPKLKLIIEKKAYKDAKSTFQEKVQDKTRTSPVYKVISEVGPDHAKIFTVGAYVGEKLFGKGNGRSKQEAEQMAAASALEKWQV